MTTNQTTELATIDRTARDAFEPANFPQAVALAQALAKSHLMPKALASPEAIVTTIIAGRELGLSAMQSIRSIHVIEGKPALSSALIVALVKRESKVCEWFRLVESTDAIATYETKRVGDPAPTRLSFTIEQAKNAGVLGKDNWRKFPAAMLRARCETALARVVYPDLVMGLYDPEELEPARPVRDVTPPPEPPSAPRVVEATVESNPETGEVEPSPATKALRSRYETTTDPAALAVEVAAAIKDGTIPAAERPLLAQAHKNAVARLASHAVAA